MYSCDAKYNHDQAKYILYVNVTKQLCMCNYYGTTTSPVKNFLGLAAIIYAISLMITETMNSFDLD